MSFVTHSAIVADGMVFVGTASSEERVAEFAPKACWTWHFRGSVLALDVQTGAIQWAARDMPCDAGNVGCGLNIAGLFVVPPNDDGPDPKGPDRDFAQGPMPFGGNSRSNDGGHLVGAGRKSGMFWAFNAKTGKLAWSRQVAPVGPTGGLQMGVGHGRQRHRRGHRPQSPDGAAATPGVWTLKDGSTTTAGGWAALDAKSGAVQWTTQDPLGSRTEVAVSGASGVTVGCNMDPVNATMHALEAKMGQVPWSFDGYAGSPTNGACPAGPSIADGMVFCGTGTFVGTGPKKVFAFGLLPVRRSGPAGGYTTQLAGRPTHPAPSTTRRSIGAAGLPAQQRQAGQGPRQRQGPQQRPRQGGQPHAGHRHAR